MGKINPKRLIEWEDALELMTEDELDFVLGHPVGHYKEFINMAWEKKWEYFHDPFPVSEVDAMITAIVNILKGLGCQCKLIENREIGFLYQGRYMELRIDSQYEYIIISDHSWNTVNVNSSHLVSIWMKAINKANIWNNVTIALLIDEEEEVMEVYSHTSMPYYPNEAYLLKFIQSKLDNMLKAHVHFEYFMQEIKEELGTNSDYSMTKTDKSLN